MPPDAQDKFPARLWDRVVAWIGLLSAVFTSGLVFTHLRSLAMYSDSAWYTQTARIFLQTGQTSEVAPGFILMLAGMLKVGGVTAVLWMNPVLWCLGLGVLFLLVRRIFPEQAVAAGFACLAAAWLMRPGLDGGNFLMYVYRTTPTVVLLLLASLALCGAPRGWGRLAMASFLILLAALVREPSIVALAMLPLWFPGKWASKHFLIGLILLGLASVLFILVAKSGQAASYTSQIASEGLDVFGPFVSQMKGNAYLTWMHAGWWFGFGLVGVGTCLGLHRAPRSVMSLLLISALLLLVHSFARVHTRYVLPSLVLLTPLAGFGAAIVLADRRIQRVALVMASVALPIFVHVQAHQFRPLGREVTPSEVALVSEAFPDEPLLLFMDLKDNDLEAVVAMYTSSAPIKLPPGALELHEEGAFLVLTRKDTGIGQTAQRLMHLYDFSPVGSFHWRGQELQLSRCVLPDETPLDLDLDQVFPAERPNTLWIDFMGHAGWRSVQVVPEGGPPIKLAETRGSGWVGLELPEPSLTGGVLRIIPLDGSPLSRHVALGDGRFPVSGVSSPSTLNWFNRADRASKYPVEFRSPIDIQIPIIQHPIDVKTQEVRLHLSSHLTGQPKWGTAMKYRSLPTDVEQKGTLHFGQPYAETVVCSFPLSDVDGKASVKLSLIDGQPLDNSRRAPSYFINMIEIRGLTAP